jgi:hypothetical protein
VTKALLAWSTGSSAAALTTDATYSAYHSAPTGEGTAASPLLMTYYFNNYTASNGVVLNGSFSATEVIDGSIMTISFNGSVSVSNADSVTAVGWNNYVTTLNGSTGASTTTGALEYTLSDGSVWRYDYSTKAWTKVS